MSKFKKIVRRVTLRPDSGTLNLDQDTNGLVVLYRPYGDRPKVRFLNSLTVDRIENPSKNVWLVLRCLCIHPSGTFFLCSRSVSRGT